MNTHAPNIRPVIRQLDDAAINRIAAGEVVERPASAVKELVENAIDAGATRVRIDIADGGKTLIRVGDDGCGMAADDLPLALSRHATSKIDGTDLLNIHSFGFRGEALPSLGAVGRLTLQSRARGEDPVEITVAGGVAEAVKPCALNGGTVVTLRDLFYATPARLKFLRSDRAEMMAIADVIKRLAMAEPSVGFTLCDTSGGGSRVTFDVPPESGDLFDALRGRLARVMGQAFVDNAVPVDATREGIRLVGYASLPTYSRGAAVAQHLFVNGRPVKDRMLIGALRGAYADFLSRDRHPAVALFVECNPREVDVNVHPAKSEVRFREAGNVRGLIVTALRHALAEAGHRASSTVADGMLGAMRPEPAQPRIYQMERPAPAARAAYHAEPVPSPAAPGLADAAGVFAGRVEAGVSQDDPVGLPLGVARGQVHENYIIAQTDDGMVIVDQHAAHERLVYEKLKGQMADNGVSAQALLIPEIVDLSSDDHSQVMAHSEALAQMGLEIDAFGPTAIAIRATPAILGEVNGANLLRDVLDELADHGSTQLVQERIEAILSRVACHGSIRSGRRMQGAEMNALLREMEAVPHSGQCNHGRPTYVELKLADIEKLFGRT